MLKVLVSAEGRWVSGDALCDAIWPDVTEERAKSSLRNAMHFLRHCLEPDLQRYQPSTFVINGAQGYRLLVGESVALDSVAFEKGADAAERISRDGDIESAIRHGTGALDLYRGDFLGDEPFAEWAALPREHLRIRYFDLVISVSRWLRGGDRTLNERALHYVVQAIQRGPEQEVLYREAMWHLVVLQRRAEAIALYHQCREFLNAELGIEPSLETTRLFERILDDSGAQTIKQLQTLEKPNRRRRRRPQALVVDFETFERMVELEERRQDRAGDPATVVVFGEGPLEDIPARWDECSTRLAPLATQPPPLEMADWQGRITESLRQCDVACPVDDEHLAVLLFRVSQVSVPRIVERLLSATRGEGARRRRIHCRIAGELSPAKHASG
ncbi:MAG TPA: bacterial transcriptional activator domain-containing protein [Limnochordia bacterium]|nr:bacterial transcriptional activator domain-containing protein [Limnochordia bacterium]